MKLHVNELRIGNLFVDKYSKKVISVLELLRNGNIVFDFECFGEWQAEPIPLTEAKLLELGFEKLNAWDDMDIYRNGKIDIEVNNLGFYFDETKVESVHHLQNIYHALTGEELTPITK